MHEPQSRSPLFSIVLVGPEIPGNTGSIGRTCVALNIPLILIGPLGFDLDERSVRRAGLDYWKHLQLIQYESFEEFINQRRPTSMSFYSKMASKSFFQNKYKRDSYLIFGNETKGLPRHLFQQYGELFYSLPIYSKQVRSLNLANAATAVAYEALRQLLYPTTKQLPSHSLTG